MSSAEDEDAASPWVAWEPVEWVAERGATDGVESEHFVVRWGAARDDDAFSEADALQLLRWLESAWALFGDPRSPQHFVTPYAARGWNCDGVRRKLNAYVGATGLAPWPADASWAHQGTHAECCADVAHASSNPRALIHHSYLTLCPAAARSESTVVHELTHVLQMHTGGHVDSACVGYQWEAHAEYCVHLYRPGDAAWAHGLDAFLESAHLPPGATRPAPGGPDGRQYVVWPFYAWLDRHFGPRTAHGLWTADFAQRCSNGSGASQDGLTTLAARLGGWTAVGAAMGDSYAAAVATAHFGADASADGAIRSACNVLAPRRMARLHRLGDDHTWQCDASKPLKQHGVCVHRLSFLDAASAASVQVRPAASASPAVLRYVLVGFNPATGTRLVSAVCVCGGDDDGICFPDDASDANLVWLLAVTAAPDAPVAVPWGIEPDALPSYGYTVSLRGCAPHAA